HDADDGSRADNDAKHRQKSAEPMRIHRAKRHREGLVEPIPHRCKEPGPCRWLFHRHGRCGSLGLAVSRIRDDFAIANFNDALRAGSDLPVMRDDDDGASFAVELLKNAEDFFSAMTVKRAGWFVGKDDVRIVDQRAGDGNALLLSAGQLARAMMRALAHAEPLQDQPGFLTPRFLFLPRINGRDFDIAHRIQFAQKMVSLENETEMLAPQLRELSGFKL